MMENAITVSLSPLQLFLSVAMQVWFIVFPIILIRKINYLTTLIRCQMGEENKEE